MIQNSKQLCYFPKLRKILFFVFLVIGLANNSFGLPLVLKVTKEIKNEGLSDLVELDTSKLRQARISISFAPSGSSKVDTTAEDKLLQSGDISKAEYDRRIQSKGYQSQTTEHFLYAVEGNEEVLIERTKERNFLIDSLPSRLKIKVTKAGTYKIYIWAE